MEDGMTFEELQQCVSVCLDEIIKLKQENANLREGYNKLLKDHEELVRKFQNVTYNVDMYLHVLENGLDSVKYELNDPRMDITQLFIPKMYAIEDTIEMIVHERKSMARFGDGEFAIMANYMRQGFQRLDSKLTERLREVIQVRDDGFLIAIADNYGDLNQYSKKSREEIRNYLSEEVRKEHYQFLDKDRIYHNTYISRPYVIYADNMTDAPRKRFENLKRIWDKRNVIIVEGSLTRLGVGNNLFANASRIQRIEAPATSSFDKYDEILRAALKYAESETLFLIALGPSAGVLAYDLYCAGYQALDVGHVDLEYEWYLKGEGRRCVVKNKYNNELPGGSVVDEELDEEYLKQIIYSTEAVK